MHRVEIDKNGEKEIIIWDEQDPLADINEQRFTMEELVFRAPLNFHIHEWESEDDLIQKVDDFWIDFLRNPDKYDDGKNPQRLPDYENCSSYVFEMMNNIVIASSE